MERIELSDRAGANLFRLGASFAPATAGHGLPAQFRLCRVAHGYAIAADLITETTVADLYAVPAADVQIFRIPALNVVKISFPRSVSQASLHDRDIHTHTGQHHVPLACLAVP